MSALFSPRLLGLGLVLVVTISLAETASASTVILLRPANPRGIASEALVRVHGELISAGYDIEFATADEDVASSLQRFAAGPGVDAVVAILGDDAPEEIEVWIVDKRTGRPVVKRTPYQPGDEERPVEVLAIRAIELLRASLLESDMAAAAPTPAPPLPSPVVVTRFVDRTVEAGHDARWGVEVGASLVTSTDGLGPTFLPLLRLDRVLGSWCVAQATVAGLGTQARVGSAMETAQVTQQLALVGANIRLRAAARVRPSFSLGAGVLHTSVEGMGVWPYLGRTAGQWSFLLDTGVGVRVALGNHYEVAIEAHAQFAEPYPVVQFVGVDVASAGRPNLLFVLTLVAWL